MGRFALDDVSTRIGSTVRGPDGEKVGSLQEIYFDRQTGEPEWAAVSTGLFGRNLSFVPLDGAKPTDDELTVGYDKDTIKKAPNVDPDGELSADEEQRLYSHYGRDWGEWDDSTPDRTEQRFGRDDAMTRSEEELSVGTERRAAGRARLRKYVVTVNVTKTVPVQREEVRIEREPITDANRAQAMSGPDITEAEHEVTLHEEVPVVDKKTVAKERVRLDTDTVTEEKTINEEVRKEQIETERDAR